MDRIISLSSAVSSQASVVAVVNVPCVSEAVVVKVTQDRFKYCLLMDMDSTRENTIITAYIAHHFPVMGK
jgi:hypothetical protein